MQSIVNDMCIDFRIDGDPTTKSQRGTVFVKTAWTIDPHTGVLKETVASELQNDFRDETLTPRVPPHSDYYPWKRHTDVAILGSAYSANAKLVDSLDVVVNLGKRRKALKVFGRRFIEFSGSVPRIGKSEPFVNMPLGIENAYGGGDFRVPFDVHNTEQTRLVMAQADHPGLYPRNPWGTGYLVDAAPIERMPLPSQEDAMDLLRNDRLITHAPQLWYKQPIPAHLDWVPANNFPRCLFFAPEAEPWFEGPDDEQLPEVRKGILASGYRKHLKEYLGGGGPHWRFFQEAPHDQIFSRDVHGLPIEIEGMHPQFQRLRFALPVMPPRIELGCESTLSSESPLLTSVEIRPNDLSVSLVYTLSLALPRPLIPGIHKTIPLVAKIDGQTVAYEAPPTQKQLLAQAKVLSDTEESAQ